MEVEWVKNDFSTDLSLRIDVFLVNRDGLQNVNCQKKVNWIGRPGGRGVNVSPLTIFSVAWKKGTSMEVEKTYFEAVVFFRIEAFRIDWIELENENLEKVK